MRVLIGINQLSDFGGTQTYCVDLVHQLVDSGHDVDVYCLYSAPVMTRGVEAAGARLYTYPSFPRSVPDRAIVMHPLATFMTLNRIPHSVPAMAVIHGVVPYEYPVRLSRIDAFIAVSPFIRDTLIARDRVESARITVISNGIDIDKFNAPVVHGSLDTIRIL